MKLKDLFYELLAIPLFVPLLHNNVFAYEYTYPILDSFNVQIIDDDRVITTQWGANWSHYSWIIDSNWNMQTTYNWDTAFGLFLPINNPYNQLNNTLSVFWNNWQLYVYSNDTYWYQWYYRYFCTWSLNNYASNITNDFIDCLTTLNGWLLSWSSDAYVVDYLTPISEFNTNPRYHDNIVWILYVDRNAQWNYNPDYSAFWFVYSDNSFVIFPAYLAWREYFNLTWSLNITQTQPMSFAKFKSLDSLVWNAPNVWFSWPTLNPITDYNNWEIWDSYANLWYVKSLCYGDFALDDLAVSWDIEQFYPDYEDGVYYTWASVFDLYNVYSWGYGFDQFMNSYLSFWYQSYNNNTARYFVGRSKWLWYLQYKVYIHRSTISQFSYSNLYNYCSFALSYNPSIDADKPFTWSYTPPSSVVDGVNDINDTPIFPSSWSVFYNTWAFIPWWWAWWWGNWWVWSWWAWWGGSAWWDDLDCSDLDNPITQFKCFFSMVSSTPISISNYSGVLPSFIGLFFLLALLFYWLKR